MLGTIYGVNYTMAKFNLGLYGSHNASLAISFGGEVLEVVELERWVGEKNAAFFYTFPIENPIEVLNEILDYFDKKYGARALKRAIQKYIEDALAEEIVNSKLTEGDTITMDLDEQKNELTIKIKKGKKVKEKRTEAEE